MLQRLRLRNKKFFLAAGTAIADGASCLRTTMRVLFILAAFIAACSSARLPGHHLQLHSAPQHRPADTPPSSSTVVPLFADLTSSYEAHWLHEVVLSGIKEECGITLRIEDRKNLHRAASPAGGVLIALGGMDAKERQTVSQLPAQQTQRMVLLHLSDESDGHDISMYNRFGTVYRNYRRDITNATLAYLASEEGAAESAHARELMSSSLDHLSSKGNAPRSAHARSLKAEWAMLSSSSSGEDAENSAYVHALQGEKATKVFWFPLGYAMNVLHNPSLMTPPSSRPLLWAWTGSTTGRVGGLSVFLCNWSNMLQFNACNWINNVCN
jgi:hypothetical protein